MDFLLNGRHVGWAARPMALRLVVEWLREAVEADRLIEHPAPYVWHAIAIDGRPDVTLQLRGADTHLQLAMAV